MPIQLHSYDTNVLRVLNHQVPGDNVLRFGVELELRPGRNFNREALLDEYTEKFAQYPIFIAKRDGSIGEGVELVTLPLSIEALSVFFEEFLPASRAQTHSSCGVHIHVSKAPLLREALPRMTHLIHRPHARWQDFLDLIALRAPNQYCRRGHGWSYDEYTKYNALNTKPPFTVEFRLFNSTNTPDIMQSYLEFAHSFIHYAQEHTQCTQSEPIGFVDYVASHRQQYRALTERLLRSAAFQPFRTSATISVPEIVANEASVGSALIDVQQPPVIANGELQTRTPVPSYAELCQFALTNWGAVRMPERRDEIQRFYSWYRQAVGYRIITRSGRVYADSTRIHRHARYHLERAIANYATSGLSNAVAEVQVPPYPQAMAMAREALAASREIMFRDARSVPAYNADPASAGSGINYFVGNPPVFTRTGAPSGNPNTAAQAVPIDNGDGMPGASRSHVGGAGDGRTVLYVDPAFQTEVSS